MDRAEATGFGIATAGHIAIFAALSLGVAVTKLPAPRQQPIEVAFVDEVGLESTAPVLASVEPAPLHAPEPGPPQPSAAPSMDSLPVPQAVTGPALSLAPAIKPIQRRVAATPAPAPPTPATGTRSTGRLSGLLTGIGERENQSRSSAPPATAVGAAVQSSLARAVREQLKPHWKAPTGADAELLRTRLSIWLAPNGSVTKIEVIDTTGQTPSNRPQVKLHQEQAIRAVRLAAPFRLPAEYYDAWKFLSPIGFDRKLSQ